ncbi:MAG TPA: hypothetical protein VFK33_01675 [Bacillales bacterium]|nr:hypothetical protein [Bacillales bacterium]
MDSTFIKLPVKFRNDRIFLYPVTENGDRLAFYTDTGGGGMFIEPDIAEQLNLPVVRKEIAKDEEHLFVSFPNFQENTAIPPGFQSDELLLLSDIPWGQGFLGQSWFADRIWKLDYLEKKMSYSQNGTDYDKNGYRSIPIGFQHDDFGNRQASFPRVQAKIDGESLDFLFDTGATVYLTEAALETFGNEKEEFQGTSFITQSQFDKWRTHHPEWPVIEHADRYENQAMIQVSEVEVAGYKIGPVWFTRRPDSNFHEYMSKVMDKRIDGALGGSVFKYFSIIIDYPNAVVHFNK